MNSFQFPSLNLLGIGGKNDDDSNILSPRVTVHKNILIQTDALKQQLPDNVTISTSSSSTDNSISSGTDDYQKLDNEHERLRKKLPSLGEDEAIKAQARMNEVCCRVCCIELIDSMFECLSYLLFFQTSKLENEMRSLSTDALQQYKNLTEIVSEIGEGVRKINEEGAKQGKLNEVAEEVRHSIMPFRLPLPLITV